MSLVERDQQLAALESLAAGLPTGSVALIGAEAGAGKSALLRECVARMPSGLPLRSGRCDDLATPASFAPLWDMADTLPATVSAALDGDGPRVPVALSAALREEPSVLILDDVQWADEATVDLIGHLGRRIDTLPLVLCLAYRSDEIDRDHPLRRVLGELSRTAVRIDLPALTLRGVRELAGAAATNVTRIYARSGGNPFFVTELLAHPGLDAPRAASDAVLARVASLPPAVWQVLDVAALAPEGVPLDLLADLGPEAEDLADAAVERGLLEVSATRLRCRHDLVRTALSEQVPPVRRRSVHRFLVERLAPRARSAADVAQVAAHAIGAADDAPAAEFSLRAADRAAEDRAHREAVRHYGHALARREHIAPDALDRALDACAHEAYVTHDLELALACAQELRERGRMREPGERARRTAWCARLAHYAGDAELALALADESVQLCAVAGDPLRESHARWWHALLSEDTEAAERFGTATVALAQTSGDLQIAAHVLVAANGTAAGSGATAMARMTAGLEMARLSGTDEQAARAYCNLSYLTVVDRELETADLWLDEGLAWTWDEDLTFWWDAMIDTRAMLRMFRGDWAGALEDCARTIDGRRALRWQVCAAATRATILVRRGDPDADEARRFADATAEAAGPDALFASAVHAEAAWTTGGDGSRAVRDLQDALAGRAAPDPWLVAGVAFWLAKIDPALISAEVRASAPPPLALELSGDLAGAAAEWRRRGCVVEAAVLDALGDDDAAMRAAFAELTALGADATAARLRAAARSRGMRAPRGVRAATASDPDGLTPRQVEVLRLLGERLTDAQIAERLYLSEKTVGHHVSAILARLGVDGRREAGAHARARFPSAPGMAGESDRS